MLNGVTHTRNTDDCGYSLIENYLAMELRRSDCMELAG
jgi:hypothetical protein